jgi:Ca2+:H+ antiporter
LFTFRTHSHIFDGANKDKNDDDVEFADEADATVPAWSIPFSCMLMLVATLLYALIAENVVSELKPTIHALNIKQEYLGLTLIALVPAVTEIINAIKFALSGQITLSLQTGSSSAVQIALIQMPVLVFMSLIANHGSVTRTHHFSPRWFLTLHFLGSPRRTAGSFVLIFPIITVFVVLAAVITFNYIAAEGRTNYFKGTALIAIYLITIFAFYFVPNQDPFKDRLAPVAPPMEAAPSSPMAP